jgi:hypothetical protein
METQNLKLYETYPYHPTYIHAVFCMFSNIIFYFLCFKIDNFVFSTCNVYFFHLLLFTCTPIECGAQPLEIYRVTFDLVL